jgi:hypothetical protein
VRWGGGVEYVCKYGVSERKGEAEEEREGERTGEVRIKELDVGVVVKMASPGVGLAGALKWLLSV